MSAKLSRSLTFGVLALALLGVALTAKQPQARFESERSVVIFPSPWVVKGLLKPVKHLIADVYWLRAINWVGTFRSAAEARVLSDYGQFLASIDPDFREMYSFLSLALPQQEDRQWRNTEEAVALLNLGLKRYPKELRLWLFLAQTRMVFQYRYPEAAEAFKQALPLPGCPPFVRALISRLLATGGDFESAVEFLDQMKNATDDEEEKAQLERRKVTVWLERELRRIDAARDRYLAAFKRAPHDVAELTSTGFLVPPPVDPLGGTFGWGDDGLARSSSMEGRLKVYRDDRLYRE